MLFLCPNYIIVTIWQNLHMEVHSCKHGLLRHISTGMASFFKWLITYCCNKPIFVMTQLNIYFSFILSIWKRNCYLFNNLDCWTFIYVFFSLLYEQPVNHSCLEQTTCRLNLWRHNSNLEDASFHLSILLFNLYYLTSKGHLFDSSMNVSVDTKVVFDKLAILLI